MLIKTKKLIWENLYQKFYNEIEDWKLTLESSPGVVMLVANDKGVLLLNHLRIDGISIETPRGYVEDNETSNQACIRELKEELNIPSKDIKHITNLGEVNSDNSYIRQHIYYKLVDLGNNYDLIHFKYQHSEGVESSKWYSWELIYQLIHENVIHDGFTMTALAFVFERKLNK